MDRATIRGLTLIVLLLAAAMVALLKPAVLATPAAAKPAFMELYNQDAYAKPTLKGQCLVYHISRQGGERNDFGEAFADGGFLITADLRQKYPERFLKEGESPKP